MKYAKTTDGPAAAAANPGRRKKPELNIAPVLIAKTSKSPSVLLSWPPDEEVVSVVAIVFP